jgi:hypothetical protein
MKAQKRLVALPWHVFVGTQGKKRILKVRKKKLYSKNQTIRISFFKETEILELIDIPSITSTAAERKDMVWLISISIAVSITILRICIDSALTNKTQS